MKPFVLGALALAAVAGPGQAAAQPGEPQSRYTRFQPSQCRDQAPPNQQEVGDELTLRCPGVGGVPVWIHYQDSNRLYVGFGRVANVTGTFAVDRRETWPMEWRGRTVRGRFTPHAVIIRLRTAGAETASTDLVVWRITPDGLSCIVNRIGAGPDQNRLARDSADRVRACESPPERINP
jgi:hypothetical protein